MLNISNFVSLVLFFALAMASTSTTVLAANSRAKKCEDALSAETKREQFQRERDLHYLMKEAAHVLEFWKVGYGNDSYNVEKLNRINNAAQYLDGFNHRLYGGVLRSLDFVLNTVFPSDPLEQRQYFTQVDSSAVLIIGELVGRFSDVLIANVSVEEGSSVYNDRTLYYISNDIKSTAHYLLEQNPEQIRGALDPLLLQIEQLQDARRIKIQRINERLDSGTLSDYRTKKIVIELAELVHEDYLVDIYYRSIVLLKNVILLHVSTIDKRLQKALVNIVYTLKDMSWFLENPSVMLEDELYKSFMKAYAGADVVKPSRAQFDALISTGLPGEDPSAAEYIAENTAPDTTPYTIIYRNPYTNALNLLLPSVSRVRVADRNYIVQRGEYLNGQLHILMLRTATQRPEWVNTETTMIHPQSDESAIYDDLSFN